MSTVNLPTKRPRPAIPDSAIDTAAQTTGFSAPAVGALIPATSGAGAPIILPVALETRGMAPSAVAGPPRTTDVPEEHAALRTNYWGKRDGPVIALKLPEPLDHALRLLAVESRSMPSKLTLEAVIEYLERRNCLPPKSGN